MQTRQLNVENAQNRRGWGRDATANGESGPTFYKKCILIPSPEHQGGSFGQELERAMAEQSMRSNLSRPLCLQLGRRAQTSPESEEMRRAS